MPGSRSNKVDDSPTGSRDPAMENSDHKLAETSPEKLNAAGQIPQKNESDPEAQGRQELSDEEKAKIEENKAHEEQEREEIDRLAKPFWLAKVFVKYPWIVVSVMWVLILIVFAITGIFQLFVLSDNSERDYLVWGDYRVQNWDMRDLAQEDMDEAIAGSQQSLQVNQPDQWATSLFFTCDKDDCNLFTVDNIKKMYEAEKAFLNHKDFTKFCKATSDVDTTCAPEGDGFKSIAQKFFKTQLDANTLTDGDIATAYATLKTDPEWTDYKFLLGKDFDRNAASPKTSYVRTIIELSNPIEIDGKRYKSAFDDEKGQDEECAQFMLDVRPDVEDVSEGDFEARIFNGVLSDKDFFTIFAQDFYFIGLSITLVFLYMWFHLKSLWLTINAMINIIVSFPVTLIIYRGAFFISYYSFLHNLLVFVVLGIAADDVFVFADAWKQTAHMESIKDDRVKRMSLTWKRATKAMFVTTSTTAVAFLANVFSKLMPIRSLGIFAATIIPVNYMLVITIFPAHIIIHERYFSKLYGKMWACITRKNKKEEGNENAPNEIEGGQSSQEPKKEKKGALLERFFAGPYMTFLKFARWAIIPFALLWVAFAIWRVTKMGALSEQEKWLPSSHPLQVLFELNDEYTSGGDADSIKMYIMYGIDGIDKGGVGLWDSTEFGSIEYSETFDLSKHYKAVYDTCQELKTQSFVLDGDVTCWLEDLRTQVGAVPFDTSAIANFDAEIATFAASTPGKNAMRDGLMGYLDNKLKFMMIKTLATGEAYQPYSIMEKVLNPWEDWLETKNNNVADTLGEARWASQAFVWMPSERAFVSGAVTGIIISIVFAFIILLLATLNVVIATYSMLCVGFIVISVVAVMQLAGWEFGVAESIAVVVLIGFSVDYVVHLANHYVESALKHRRQRIRHALKEIGISIISGAITTVLSGAVLIFCVVIMFDKFAIIIVATIFFSFVASIGVFSSLCHLIGPNGTFGDLRFWVVRPITNLMKKQFQNCKDRRNAKDGDEKDEKKESSAQPSVEAKPY